MTPLLISIFAVAWQKQAQQLAVAHNCSCLGAASLKNILASMFASDEKLQPIILSLNLFYRGLEIEDYSKNKRS